MADYSKSTGPRTSVWRNGPTGQALVKVFDGLPYDTQSSVQIPDLGEATLVGIQRTGSGIKEAIIEVRYVLKS